MKVLLYLCFILFVTDEATGLTTGQTTGQTTEQTTGQTTGHATGQTTGHTTGQTTGHTTGQTAGQTTDTTCENVADFGTCSDVQNICDLKISSCICYQNEPFCRCHSKKGEFYLDEDCTQSWTVMNFALVASLPGLTLAVLVGVIVYVIMLSSNKNHKGKSKEMTTPKIDKEQDLFPGIAFASDMNGRPPPNMRPGQQDHVSMKAMPNRPYSVSSEMRDPQMGGPARPYGPSSGMRISVDRMSDGRPHEPNNMYSGMREPPMGGPMQPYSNGGTRAHVVSNPYARDSPSRNPYDNHIPSSDHHSDHISHASSHLYDDLKHNQPYSAAPSYGSSDHGFPRPQLSQRY